MLYVVVPRLKIVCGLSYDYLMLEKYIYESSKKGKGKSHHHTHDTYYAYEVTLNKHNLYYVLYFYFFFA